MSTSERLEKVSQPDGRRKLLAWAVVGAVAALTRVGGKTVEAAWDHGFSSPFLEMNVGHLYSADQYPADLSTHQLERLTAWADIIWPSEAHGVS